MRTAARNVFAERGYALASIEEIADRSEFGKGTLYNYLPSGKRQILRAVLDEVFDQLDALHAPLLDAPPDTESFRRALRAYAERSAQSFYDDRDLYSAASNGA